MASSIVLVSGGLKGAVAAARCASDDELVLLHANYGQPSRPAQTSAVRALADAFPAARVLSVDLPHLSQIETQFDEGPAAPASSKELRAPSPTMLLGLMPALLSAGVQCALRGGAARVVVGLSRLVDSPSVGLGEVGGQPPRRREFVHSYNLMVEALLAMRSSVRIEAPLMDSAYADIVKSAVHFDLPVGNLWTCEGIGPRPCKRCQSCVARARAFAEARYADPLTAPRAAPAGSTQR